MILFVLFAAGLLVLALLFILPPILRQRRDSGAVDENQANLAIFRQQLAELDADLATDALDQGHYDSARHDLEKGLLLDLNEATRPLVAPKSGRWAAPLLVVVVPLLAVGLYLWVGDYRAMEPLPSGSNLAQADHADMPSMEVLVARLAARMQTRPDDLQGWVMLGRSALALGQGAQAVAAYAQANRLAPREPDVLLAYAEALAQVAKGDLTGKPAELIRAALGIAPTHPGALWMMGLVDLQSGAPAQAVARWTRLQAQISPDGEDAKTLRRFITEARQQAGMTPESAVTPVAEAAPAQAAAPASPKEATDATANLAIQVQVTLGTGMQGRFAPDDTLFVFAHALKGPPMPLAVQRMQARDLPVTLTLDDRMAMAPQMRLSNFPQVRVGARISRSGNALPQSGDLQGEVEPVTPGQTEPVRLVINEVRP